MFRRRIPLIVASSLLLALPLAARAQSESKLVDEYKTLAGSEANAKSLVSGLRDAFDGAAQQDEQHPGRGRRHCRIALIAPLWCSVRLMNQTPANTKAMPSTFSASTLSSR